MNNLMIFEGNNIEVFEFEGRVLFNPKHVAECLEIKDVTSVVRNFNDKQIVKLTNSIMHSMHFRKLHNTGENFLTESGVYKLIFKSRKENAERFQDWVTDEVLPQIRQTGGYIPMSEEDSEAEIMAKALLVAHKTIERKNEQLKLKEQQVLELTPKAEVFDMFVDKEHTLTFREIRKEVESALSVTIKETILKEIMRDMKLIGKTVKASQYAIRNGFAVTKDIVDNQGKTRTQDRFTMKTRDEILSYIKTFPHML